MEKQLSWNVSLRTEFLYPIVSSSDDSSCSSHETLSSSDDESDFEVASQSVPCSPSNPLADKQQTQVRPALDQYTYPSITFTSLNTLVSEITTDESTIGDFNSPFFGEGENKNLQNEIEALKYLVSKNSYFSKNNIFSCLERISEMADGLGTKNSSRNITETSDPAFPEPTEGGHREASPIRASAIEAKNQASINITATSHRTCPKPTKECLRKGSPTKDGPMEPSPSLIVPASTYINRTKACHPFYEPRKQGRSKASPANEVPTEPSISSSLIVPSKGAVDVKLPRTSRQKRRSRSAKKLGDKSPKKRMGKNIESTEESNSNLTKRRVSRKNKSSRPGSASSNFAGEVIETVKDDPLLPHSSRLSGSTSSDIMTSIKAMIGSTKASRLSGSKTAKDNPSSPPPSRLSRSVSLDAISSIKAVIGSFKASRSSASKEVPNGKLGRSGSLWKATLKHSRKPIMKSTIISRAA